MNNLKEKWLPARDSLFGIVTIILLLCSNFSRGQFVVSYDSINHRIEVFTDGTDLLPIDSIPILIGNLKAFQHKDSTLYFLTEAYTMQGEKTYAIYCCNLSTSKGYVIRYNYFLSCKEILPPESKVHLNESGLSFEIDKNALSINISFAKLDKIRTQKMLLSFIQGVTKLSTKLN